MVETLRVVRDTYRAYLKPKVQGPLVEMYWVVTRLAVKDWALVRLRQAASTYILVSFVGEDPWNALFSFATPLSDFNALPEKQGQGAPGRVLSQEAVATALERLLPEDVFDEILLGGPFGREGQIQHARSAPVIGFPYDGGFYDAVRLREAAWDAALPWMEGLSRLFDATQEELLYQMDSLGSDARMAEALYVQLPLFQRIAHKHLAAVNRHGADTARPGKEVWTALLHELNASGLCPDQALEGTARAVLMALRRKQKPVRTWAECYASSGVVTLEDGKARTLRREMMHAAHNAAKKVEYQLRNTWGAGSSTTQPGAKAQKKRRSS